MKRKVYEVKTLEEAQKLAIEDLGVAFKDLKFNILSEKKGFLGIGSKVEVEALCDVDGVQRGKEYLQMILKSNGIEGFIEKKVRDNNVEFNIDADEFNGYLIGKNSRTLIALQTLITIVVNNYYGEEEKMNVIVDVNGYKKRRERRLEKMAVDIAKEVARTKNPVKVDHLNAYERKIVHNKLSAWKDVETHSEGEEPNRYLIITSRNNG